MSLIISTLVLSAPSAASDYAPGAVPPDTALQRLSDAPDDFTVADYLGAVESAIDDVDRYPLPAHDLFAAGLALGSPEEMFAFVRDEIRTEAYAGSLRDPEAVLSGRAGNAQDKAELLMTLLREAGYEARIAAGERGGPMGGAPGQCGAAGDGGPDPLTLTGIGASGKARLQARAARDMAALGAALPEDLGKGGQIAAAPKTHYFVQMRQGADWIDLDPNTAGAAFGQSTTPVTALGRGGEDPHMIRLSVRVETWTDRGPREREVLKFEGAARDLASSRVQLVFTPENTGTGGAVATAFAEALDVPPRMAPVLLVDDDQIEGGLFNLPGRISELKGLGEITDPPVSAVWLEVTATDGAGGETTQRRALLDIVPTIARTQEGSSAEALFYPAMGQQLPLHLEGLRTLVVMNGGLDARSAAIFRALALYHLPEVAIEAEENDIDASAAMWREWGQTYGIAAASEDLARSWQHEGACPALTKPRVALFTKMDTVIGPVSLVDWTLDHIGVAGTSDPQAAAQVRLWHGVLQSSLETTLAENLARVQGEAEVVSTSTLLDGSLSPVDTLPRGGVMAREDLDAGYLLLSAPAGLPSVEAWWRVSPTSGSTDARLASFGNASHWHYPGGLSQVGHDYQRWYNPYNNTSGRVTPKQYYPGKSWKQFQQERSNLAKLRRKLKVLKETHRKKKLARYWDREMRRRGGANEYQILLNELAVPLAITVGTGVGASLMGLFYYALTGENINEEHSADNK